MTLAPFVRSGGIHPTIDFPALAQHYPDLELDVSNIGSPSNLIAWEELRRKHGLTLSPPVPCDLFVWGRGKPPDPRMTRVGGVPWLPRRRAWPQIGEKAATFVCQFDFRESRDLVGELPADLLLMFAGDEDSLLEEEGLAFVWVSAEESDVISAREVPADAAAFPVMQAWGARYRSADFPSCWELVSNIESHHGEAQLPVSWATKIGGVPYSSQQRYDEAPAGYLCQLCSIQASHDREWPWVDRKTPLGLSFSDAGIYGQDNQLMIGDMGEITLFLGEDGSVGVEAACG